MKIRNMNMAIIATFLSGCAVLPSQKRYFDSYIETRFKDSVRQQLDKSCGLAALSDILIYRYEQEANEYTLLKKAGMKPRYSFGDLISIAEEYGKKTVPVWMKYDSLLIIKEPAILYLERKGTRHFVSLSYVTKEHIQVKDPAWGILNYTRSQFEKYWLVDNKNRGKVLIFLNQSKPFQPFPIDKKIVF